MRSIEDSTSSGGFQLPVTPDFLATCLSTVNLRASEVHLDITGRRNLVIVHEPSDSVFRFPRTAADAANLVDSAHRHRAATDVGLPVPALIAYQSGQVGAAFMQVRLLTGEGIDQPGFHNQAVLHPDRIGRQLAWLLRQLRKVPPGAWPAQRLDLPGLWAQLQERMAAVEHELPADVFDSFSTAIEQAEAASANQVEGLVHGDLGGINTRFDPPGRLTGVLDWDGAVFADVAADVAAVAVGVPAAARRSMIAAHPELAADIDRCDVYVATWVGQGALWSIGAGDAAGLAQMIDLDRQGRERSRSRGTDPARTARRETTSP